MLQTITPEQRRANNERMRARHYDQLTKLINTAENLRAGMGASGYDDESPEYFELLSAMYDVCEIDAVWEHAKTIEPSDEWDGRDALGFSNADAFRIKDDRNRVDY